MGDRIKAFLSWVAAGGVWLGDRLYGDAIFNWVRPMIPPEIMDPSASNVLWVITSLGPPAALIGLGVYFLVRGSQGDRQRAKAPQSFDNKIGFEWRNYTKGLEVSASGTFEILSFAALPPSVLSGGTASLQATPGSPVKFEGDGYQCSITNYGDAPIFNASIVFETVFWKAVEDARVAIASGGSRREKGGAKKF